jgi:H+/Cl- antiporter ClcA
VAHLSWRRLALVGAVAALAGWLITRIVVSRGATPLAVPWTVGLVCLIASATALVLAWSVRQYKRGNRPSLSGLNAARIAVFSQACAYAGAAVAGAYGGYAIALLDTWEHAPRRETAVSAMIAALAGLILLVAGVIAEHWCRTDRRDDDADRGATASQPN